MLTNWKVWDDGVSDGELVILVFMQKMNSEQERRYSSMYPKPIQALVVKLFFCYAKRGNYAV